MLKNVKDIRLLENKLLEIRNEKNIDPITEEKIEKEIDNIIGNDYIYYTLEDLSKDTKKILNIDAK